MQSDFETKVEAAFNEMIEKAVLGREQQAIEAMKVIREMQGSIFTGGRKFTRDEMSES